jgi:hypothetical protein
MMIVIAGTGQSNSIVDRPFAWSPNASAQLWNNVPEQAGSVGTAFAALNNTTTCVMWKFASDIAAQTIDDVRLINVGFSGMAIDHWLSGYGGYPVVSPDAYASMASNIVPALAAAGKSALDYWLIWQGESAANAQDANYSAKFALLMQRLAAESWWSSSTRVVIFGIPPSSISGAAYSDVIVANLAGQAAVDPAKRRFVPSGVFPINPYWDTSTPGHMHGAGYDAAGALAAVFATEDDSGLTPYNVTVSSGTGAINSYVSAGRYKLLPGKLVVFSAQATVTSNGNGGGHLRISLPFPSRGGSYFSGGSAFDAYSGEPLSVAIAPSDPLNLHAFTASAGYPLGKSVVVTGFYERQ